MTRVAFVTGGTRGIGRAISARLKAAGYKVAAGYAGNEVAAKACADELGVLVVKGNVSSFADCAAAVKTGRGRARARSTCWSTTPASPATPCCTG